MYHTIQLERASEEEKRIWTNIFTIKLTFTRTIFFLCSCLNLNGKRTMVYRVPFPSQDGDTLILQCQGQNQFRFQEPSEEVLKLGPTVIGSLT